jgi:hypothetical protein
MRAAPALDATLDNARPERVLIVMLHVLAGLVWVAWGVLHSAIQIDWVGLLAAHAIVGLLAAGLGLWLARQALPAAAGRLAWTGHQWVLHQQVDQALHQVQVTVDLGAWLLLRLQPAANGRPLWRIARQRSAGPAWHALRVALHAHAGVAAANDDSARGRAP